MRSEHAYLRNQFSNKTSVRIILLNEIRRFRRITLRSMTAVGGTAGAGEADNLLENFGSLPLRAHSFLCLQIN